jgi:hypothetical protein
MRYEPGFDEEQECRSDTGVFENLGVPVRVA